MKPGTSHRPAASVTPRGGPPDGATQPRQPSPNPTAATVWPLNATQASAVMDPPETRHAEWMMRVGGPDMMGPLYPVRPARQCYKPGVSGTTAVGQEWLGWCIADEVHPRGQPSPQTKFT